MNTFDEHTGKFDIFVPVGMLLTFGGYILILCTVLKYIKMNLDSNKFKSDGRFKSGYIEVLENKNRPIDPVF